MSARHKLNSIYITGALGIAAVLAALAQSWSVFLLTAGILIAASIYAGNIRMHNRRR